MALGPFWHTACLVKGMSTLTLPSLRHSERRQSRDVAAPSRAGFTFAQQKALETLEYFGWRLRFVRRPVFCDPVPVAFEIGSNRYVVIGSDGTLDESQSLVLRD